MYKIGQTDGVAKCCSNVGVPVACVKTYLMKMAKSAADLPCACKAKSDMQVLASGEFAASTSSCCAGGTSSKTGSGGGGCCCGGCCGKSACGGKGCPPNLYSGSGANDEATQNVLDQAAAKEQAAFANEEQQEQPQAQIADAFKSTQQGVQAPVQQPVQEQTPGIGTTILSTIDDVLNSDVPVINQAQWETARDFQTEFCANRPYPECEFCQYAAAIMQMSEVDIVDYLRGIRDCLNALNQGQVGWAEQRFVCPGQIAAMLGAEFGTVGLLAGRTAAAAIIGSMAVHGALKSLRSFSRQAAHHDLRHELTATLCDAIRSGGGGDHYVELLNDIMCNLGTDSGDMFRARPWSRGGKGGGRNCTGARMTDHRANDIIGRTPVSERAQRCADSVKSVTDALVKPEPSNPPTKSPTTETHIPVSDRTVQIDPQKPSNDAGEPVPKTYYYLDDTGTYQPLPVQPKLGEPIAQYEQEYGTLYEKQDIGNLVDVITKTPAPAMEVAKNLVEEAKRTGTPLEDLIEEMLETAVVDNHTNAPPASGITPGNTTMNVRANAAAQKAAKERGPTLSADDAPPSISAEKVSKPKEKIPSIEATEAAYDSSVIPVSGGGGAASKALFENNLVDGRDAGKDPEDIIVAARALEALEKISDPVVLPTGFAYEPIVSVSSKDYEDNVVFTPSLITRNQVPVAEMVKLSGIGLDTYDLNMAYALDHDVNGTQVPADVRAVRIPTILDKFPEW